MVTPLSVLNVTSFASVTHTLPVAALATRFAAEVCIRFALVPTFVCARSVTSPPSTTFPVPVVVMSALVARSVVNPLPVSPMLADTTTALPVSATLAVEFAVTASATVIVPVLATWTLNSAPPALFVTPLSVLRVTSLASVTHTLPVAAFTARFAAEVCIRFALVPTSVCARSVTSPPSTTFPVPVVVMSALVARSVVNPLPALPTLADTTTALAVNVTFAVEPVATLPATTRLPAVTPTL